MQARLWNKENGQPLNKAVASDPNVREVYKESDGTEAASLFFLDPSSLIHISSEYNVDCYVRDFTERKYYLVMTEYDEKKKMLYYQYYFFPLNGWTNSMKFADYLRNHRDFFRDSFSYYRGDKSKNAKDAAKLVGKMKLADKFLKQFKAEKLLTPEEVRYIEMAIEAESKCHFAITLPRAC